MSQFSNPPLSPNKLSASSLSQAAQASASRQTLPNPGQQAIVLSSSKGKLVLANHNGQATLAAPRGRTELLPNKEVALRLNEQSGKPVLEIAPKLNQQKMTLNRQQGHQVIQQVAQAPSSFAGKVQMSGTIESTSGKQLQININGNTVDLDVANLGGYKNAQDVKVTLSSNASQWQLQVRTTTQRESLRISHHQAQKLLESLKSGQTINLSQVGQQALRPMLQNFSPSQFPEPLPHISVSKSGDNLVAQISLGAKSILSIPLSQEAKQSIQHLLRSTPDSQSTADPMGAFSASLSKSTGIGPSSTQPEAMTYKLSQLATGIENKQTSQQTLSNQNLDKTINGISGTATPNEIKLDGDHKAAGATTVGHRQPLLNALKNLAAHAIGDDPIQTNMLNRLQQQINAQAKESNVSAVQLLSSIQQLSAVTSTGTNNTLKQLLIALEELSNNQKIDEQVRHHIAQNAQNVTPEKASQVPPDMQHIRQLLQSPALPLTPVSIISPPNSGGMMAGLISLLQVSLAARLNRNNQHLQEKIGSVLTSLTASGLAGEKSGKAQKQSFKELSGAEQKHNMVKLLSDMINQHANQKLQNAERALQGQESFYYVLPFQQQNQERQTELLIQKDKPDSEQTGHAKKGSRGWLLTIKLPVGELGEILSKSRVSGDTVELDLYTSTEALKIQTMNFLPLLKQRLEKLGITMAVGRCEQGNIPDRIANNPYQLLETRV